MPGTVITGSPNITLLDSKIVADLCLGKFYIDLTPSVWITDPGASPAYDGALNVQGAKIQITNPYGVVIKSYPLSSFDIVPPMTGIYEQNIPTQAGAIQYGTYTVDVVLTDQGSPGTEYTVSKTVNVCTYDKNQNPCDDRLRLVASCRNGTIGVYVSEPPLFKGFFATTKTQLWTVKYPTASGHANTTSTFGYFSVQLFEGVYNVSGSVCATYNLTDNVFVRLPYSVSLDKTVKCNLDYTCIWPRIKQLNDKIASDCSEAEKTANGSIILDALRLITSAELANNAGEDASPYINDLEILLGCQCTCDCTGSPIINGTPSTDLAIEGCGIVKTTVGLTDIYTINNYTYLVEVDVSQNIITVSNPAINNCVVSQKVSFSIAAAYAAMKNLVNNSTEYDFWASVIKSALAGLDGTCLGRSPAQMNALTLKELFQLMIDDGCVADCGAAVTAVSTARDGSSVIISWVATGANSYKIYVDGILIGSVLAPITSYTVFEIGDGGSAPADGQPHNYIVVPLCDNDISGVPMAGTFNVLPCPNIVAPTLSSTLVLSAACPYNLNGLVLPLPSGIFAEWHTQNNTLASSLVADPTAVTDGIYYVFAKNVDDCYSTGVQVVLTCQTSGTVTAPQNPQATPQLGSLLVRFQSAAFPPPANSYTLKRRLQSDPDVDGSYTTLGSTGTGITFNSSTNLWELSDVSALDNTLYVYKFISNGGTSPFVTLEYANIVCPTIALTNDTTSIDYSFVNSGGDIDKYVVQLYDSTEVTLLDSDTITDSPAFSNPITGTFGSGSPGLSAGTYKVRVKVYIGTYVKTCEFTTITIADNYQLNASYNFTINSVTGVGVPSLSPATPGSPQSGHHTGMSGSYAITLTGALVTPTKLEAYVNGSLVACTTVTGPGVYALGPIVAAETDSVVIFVHAGVCL